MEKREALRLWPVDTEPKAWRTVKAAWSFSTVGRETEEGVTCASSRLLWSQVPESWVGQRQSEQQGCSAQGPLNPLLTPEG